MNRSLGTSSLPRAGQYAGLRKSAGVYFGGTGMVGQPLAGVLAALQRPGAFPLLPLAQPRVLVPAGRKERNGLVGHELGQRLGHRDVGSARPTVPGPTSGRNPWPPRRQAARYSAAGAAPAGRTKTAGPPACPAATPAAPAPAASPTAPEPSRRLYSGGSNNRINGCDSITVQPPLHELPILRGPMRRHSVIGWNHAG